MIFISNIFDSVLYAQCYLWRKFAPVGEYSSTEKRKKTYFFLQEKQISDSALGVIFGGNFALVLFLNILKVYNVRVTFFVGNLHQSEKIQALLKSCRL